MAERQRELEEEAADASDLREARIERTVDGFERFFGELNQAQRNEVGAFVDRTRSGRSRWLTLRG